MGKRRLASGLVLPGMIAVMSLAVAALSGQGQAPKIAKPAANSVPAAPKPPAAAKAWVAPKTPWGDPDIEGTWTSDAANGIPMQRPAQFAGRAELSDEEFKAKVERDTRTRTNAENAVGSFRGDGAWLNKSFRQTSLIVEPADGRTPPLTPEAEARRASRDAGTFGNGPFDKPEDFTLYDRCITRGILGSVLPVIYGNGNRILQTPKEVVISYEMIHDTRVIPLDGRPHVGQKIRQYLGDSRGLWEGNTLVVETTNLTDQTSIGLNGGGVRHSADMKLIERFTRTEPGELKYEVLIDDPKTYARPWKISMPLTSPPGFQLLPYECHEGNRAVSSALGGERAEDKAIEEDAKRGIIRPRKPIQGLTIGGSPLPEGGGRGRGGPPAPGGPGAEGGPGR
jgi:hypothetical protein